MPRSGIRLIALAPRRTACVSAALLAAVPTVIIGSPEAGPPEAIEQIRSAGVPVVVIPEQRQSIDAPAAKIRAVAEALGVAEAGQTLAATTQAEIDAAIARAAGRGLRLLAKPDRSGRCRGLVVGSYHVAEHAQERSRRRAMARSQEFVPAR